jgi:hypothetical protein
MNTIRALAAASVLAGVALVAGAGEYDGPNGFSFEYPQGWSLATKEDRKELERVLRGQMRGAPALRVRDLEAIVYDPAATDFTANILVVIQPSNATLEQIEGEMASAVTQGIASEGGEVLEVHSDRITIDGREALSVRYDADFGEDPLIFQWVVVVPDDGRVYVACCTARADEADYFEPLFAKAIDSMRIRTGLAALWHDTPAWLRWGLIATVVLVVGRAVFVRWQRAALRRPADAWQGEPAADPLDSIGEPVDRPRATPPPPPTAKWRQPESTPIRHVRGGED